MTTTRETGRAADVGGPTGPGTAGREHPSRLFWVALSAVAVFACTALVLLALADWEDGVLQDLVGPQLAVLLVLPLLLLAAGCWGQRGVEFGTSATARGDLDQLLVSKRRRASETPARPPTPTRPAGPPPPRPRRRHLAILVAEADDRDEAPGVLDRLVRSKQQRSPTPPRRRHRAILVEVDDDTDATPAEFQRRDD